MKYLKTYKLFESTEESINREWMIKKYGLETLEECDSIISDIKDNYYINIYILIININVK